MPKAFGTPNTRRIVQFGAGLGPLFRHARGFGPLHPGGMIENSPAFQRWDSPQIVQRPAGTVEKIPFTGHSSAISRPFGTRLPDRPNPALNETLGYCRLSLRDSVLCLRTSQARLQILLALGLEVGATLTAYKAALIMLTKCRRAGRSGLPIWQKDRGQQ